MSNIIRRTLVEHGLRPTIDGNTSTSSNLSAITTIVKQHQDDQQELQELNSKFAVYLDRVQYLERFNQRLQENLDNLKQTWGGDAEELHSIYGPQLQSIRKAMDDALRDQALQELQLKRHEYDLWQIQHQIATLDDDSDLQKFNILKQELDGSAMELDLLRNQLDQRFIALTKQRSLMDNLLKELNDLVNEYDTHQLERLMIENELQTLKEHAVFQEAIYQAQRKEILSLSTPVIDVSRFYRIELARAISDIRQDFEILSQSQVNELEEYYRVKTEQVRAEIESENERKRLLASEGAIESMDTAFLTSALKDSQHDLIGLHAENKQLQSIFDAIADDFEKIQGEHSQQTHAIDQEISQIRQLITDKQDTIDHILESNVSLRFELSTYGRLLAVEEKHMQRVQEGESLMSSYQIPSKSSTQ